MKYHLKELAAIAGGSLDGEDRAITHIITDSRRLSQASGALFVAIKGKRHDGHQFIPQLSNEAGLVAYLVECIPDPRPNGSYIVVDDTLAAMQKIAAHHRQQMSAIVIGITGSAGKTTLKEQLFRALSEDFDIVRSPRSFNSQVGVPLSLFQMEVDHDLAIFEAGISTSNEMEHLAQMILPDIGIITGIGAAHDSGFESRKQKVVEKLTLFDSCQRLIHPLDDAIIRKEIEARFQSERLFSWGRSEGADLHIIDEEKHDGRCKLTYCLGGKSFVIEFLVRDEFTIDNYVQVVALMSILGISQDKIEQRLQSGLHGQSIIELDHSKNGGVLVTDMSPIDGPTLESSIHALLQNGSAETSSIILVHDPVGTIGNDKKMMELSSIIRMSGIKDVHCVGAGLEQLSKKEEWSLDLQPTDLLAEGTILNPNILLKGIWSEDFQVCNNLLAESGHRTRMIIDMEAMVDNLNHFRSRLDPETKVMAMVKAFGYGSGDAEIAQLLDYHGVDYLTVAYTDEGVSLRKKGIRTPIMVMNWAKEDIPNLKRFDLEPEVFSQQGMQLLLSQKSQPSVTKAMKVHIKVDTGMNRLGFSITKAKQAFVKMNASDGLVVRSMFTHLLASEDKQMDERTKAQLERFKRIRKELKEDGHSEVLFHALNTAGIIRFPEYQFDMVRIGIGLYGHSPVPDLEIEDVIHLYTAISQIRIVSKGESVGYGGNNLMDSESKIATIPIGYADGLDRRMGNGAGHVLIHGKRAPFVGNICMDMSMVNVSEIDCNEGDKVVVIGEGRSIQEIASELDTIPYEVLTSISHRVKRIYRMF